jgi:hypothetical protein
MLFDDAPYHDGSLKMGFCGQGCLQIKIKCEATVQWILISFTFSDEILLHPLHISLII